MITNWSPWLHKQPWKNARKWNSRYQEVKKSSQKSTCFNDSEASSQSLKIATRYPIVAKE